MAGAQSGLGVEREAGPVLVAGWPQFDTVAAVLLVPEHLAEAYHRLEAASRPVVAAVRLRLAGVELELRVDLASAA
jgi:hypothetical protein